MRCPRCWVGYDDDGDGNCASCAKLTDDQAFQTKIRELKANWRGDPCYDIEDAEGFEAVRQELLIYRLETEKKWATDRALKAEGALSNLAKSLVPYLTFILDGRYERRPS